MAGAPEVVNFIQVVPPSPGNAATGSTAGQQAGYGVTGSFVPNSSGAVLITITGTLTNATASGGGFVGISIGTGPAPALGATPRGSVGTEALFTNNASTAGLVMPFTMQAVVTGLTLGVGYWIDMQIFGSVAGTCTPGSIMITALEL